ncbi:Hypothetical predicted protein [Pelobates cultripes]|uniref:Uncharacterized protein n=1 Tax=Pelobates cultripes TaxID=61616 RepID=A0AAD1SEB6_PELCU|nr:Hypothetical predicted protein [Pelobates cultripes]
MRKNTLGLTAVGGGGAVQQVHPPLARRVHVALEGAGRGEAATCANVSGRQVLASNREKPQVPAGSHRSSGSQRIQPIETASLLTARVRAPAAREGRWKVGWGGGGG